MQSHALEVAFTSFPDATILCDHEGKILRMNAAALKLFEVPSEQPYQGIPYQQFLQRYEIHDERRERIPLETWFLSVLLNEEDDPARQEQLFLFKAPSGRNIYLNLRCIPMLNAQQHPVGILSVFREVTHQYHKALHLQRVHEATIALSEAIARIPVQVDQTVPEETFLLLPPIAFVAQQLVEVICHVLQCHRLLLIAFEPPAGYLYYVAGSGFTAEQRQLLLENRGQFLLSDVVDKTVMTRLQNRQVAVIQARFLSLPPWYPVDLERENDLLVPLFLEQKWVGLLGIAKDDPEHEHRKDEKDYAGHEYTRDEIDLVQTVVTHAALIMECAHGLHTRAETSGRELMLHEVSRLSRDFLTLAAHELRTPLTGIKGNLQLAQRRLQTLKRQIAEQSEQFALVQHSLVAATQGTQLQERMIQDMLDDACIQAGHLEAVLEPCDLLTLAKEVIETWQQSTPPRAIILKTSNTLQRVPITADARLIKRVINRYIENALVTSSTQEPVTVLVGVEDTIARVAVQCKGTDIPLDEQGRLWEHLRQAKGKDLQRALDLSTGLGLYLCRMFIELHHGHAGVHSDFGQGSTFWFTLPLTPTQEQ